MRSRPSDTHGKLLTWAYVIRQSHAQYVSSVQDHRGSSRVQIAGTCRSSWSPDAFSPVCLDAYLLYMLIALVAIIAVVTALA
jgi:hypothetical protein